MLRLSAVIAVFILFAIFHYGVPAFNNHLQRKRYAAWQRTVESMKRAAGQTPGMKRRQRREMGRHYAKMLATVERYRPRTDGTTVRPRADIRRRQRIIAQLLGQALTPVR